MTALPLLPMFNWPALDRLPKRLITLAALTASNASLLSSPRLLSRPPDRVMLGFGEQRNRKCT